MKNKISEFLLVVFCCLVFWGILVLCYLARADVEQVDRNDEKVIFSEDQMQEGENQDKIVVSLVDLERSVVEEKEPETKNLGKFVLTAYCSCEKCCGKHALNRPKDESGNEIVYGASGAVLEQGVSIAVDPKVIPYGSVVLIDGSEYTAHDCGGAIKGNRIDVYFESHEDAREFGKKTKVVEMKVNP